MLLSNEAATPIVRRPSAASFGLESVWCVVGGRIMALKLVGSGCSDSEDRERVFTNRALPIRYCTKREGRPPLQGEGKLRAFRAVELDKTVIPDYPRLRSSEHLIQALPNDRSGLKQL